MHRELPFSLDTAVDRLARLSTIRLSDERYQWQHKNRAPPDLHTRPLHPEPCLKRRVPGDLPTPRNREHQNAEGFERALLALFYDKPVQIQYASVGGLLPLLQFKITHVSGGPNSRNQGGFAACLNVCFVSVPHDVLFPVVLKRLRQADCARKGWVLESFPQTSSQAEWLRHARLTPTHVIALDVEAVSSYFERRLQKNKTTHLNAEPDFFFFLMCSDFARFRPVSPVLVQGRATASPVLG